MFPLNECKRCRFLRVRFGYLPPVDPHLPARPPVVDDFIDRVKRDLADMVTGKCSKCRSHREVVECALDKAHRAFHFEENTRAKSTLRMAILRMYRSQDDPIYRYFDNDRLYKKNQRAIKTAMEALLDPKHTFTPLTATSTTSPLLDQQHHMAPPPLDEAAAAAVKQACLVDRSHQDEQALPVAARSAR